MSDVNQNSEAPFFVFFLRPLHASCLVKLHAAAQSRQHTFTSWPQVFGITACDSLIQRINAKREPFNSILFVAEMNHRWSVKSSQGYQFRSAHLCYLHVWVVVKVVRVICWCFTKLRPKSNSVLIHSSIHSFHYFCLDQVVPIKFRFHSFKQQLGDIVPHNK